LEIKILYKRQRHNIPIVLRQKINIGPKLARGTERTKNKSTRHRSMAYKSLISSKCSTFITNNINFITVRVIVT
jgi:hypothetical protein